MSATSQRSTQTAVAAVKLAIFTVVSILVTGLLTVIMGNFSFGAHRTYAAVFTNASLLQKGDDVRIAGIPVGEVKEVELREGGGAKVTFKAEADVPLTTASRAEIRYLNIVGDRYLALVEGPDGAERLKDGATFPTSRTTPALNLTELYNGFQPLFAALEPTQVNELSMNILKVLQGEGGTIESLLSRTASLTHALADRDALIGDVIDNLTKMLGTVNDRRTNSPNSSWAWTSGWELGEGPSRHRTLDRQHQCAHQERGRPADAGATAAQARRQAVAHADEHAGRTRAQEHAPGVAGPPPRSDHRPDPDRDVRQLVQLLPLRLPGRDHAAEVARRRHRQSPEANSDDLSFHSTAARCD